MIKSAPDDDIRWRHRDGKRIEGKAFGETRFNNRLFQDGKPERSERTALVKGKTRDRRYLQSVNVWCFFLSNSYFIKKPVRTFLWKAYALDSSIVFNWKATFYFSSFPYPFSYIFQWNTKVMFVPYSYVTLALIFVLV